AIAAASERLWKALGVRWLAATAGRPVPVSAIRCGWEAPSAVAGKLPLYLARCHYQQGMMLGKSGGNFQGCNFGYGGREAQELDCVSCQSHMMVPTYQLMNKRGVI
ncbi:unnamed protein product, partial [Polarella glacialis]